MSARVFTPRSPDLDFATRTTLGRTGLSVSRLGLGSSFGLAAKDVEHAYHEYGVNYLYWGSLRRPGFGRGLRNLARGHRDDLVVVLQTYSRLASAIPLSVWAGLKRLRLERVDVLLLGLFNKPPAPRLLDAAWRLKEKGVVRHLAVSCHNRPTFQKYLEDERFDVLHVRYNAAHRGAEDEVFPWVADVGAPGMVAFTATRWGHLLDPGRMPPATATPRARDCYRFALTHPNVDVVLCGPSGREQLNEGLQALRSGPLDADELAWMRAVGDHVHG